MAADRDQRTEKPTAKRRAEARKEGQVARSPELMVWASILVATYTVKMTFSSGERLMTAMMARVGTSIADPTVPSALALLGSGLRGMFTVLAPLLVTMPLLAIVGNVAQVGFGISGSRLAPKFSRVDPRKGLKRLLSPQSGWEAAKQVAKLAVLGLVAWKAISGAVPLLTGAGPLDVGAAAGIAAGRALAAARTVALAGLAIAAVDYWVIRRRINGQLRMTKQEVKEDAKSNDGNPLVKGAIRRKQRQLSRLRMIAAVASADAVVVNPTHVAVAIRYQPGTGAPRVVAKGVDSLALRIKAEARQHRVPMVEDRVLARALHATVRLDQEIPTELYEAVARLLSFVYSLRRTGRLTRIDGEGHVPPSPLLTA